MVETFLFDLAALILGKLGNLLLQELALANEMRTQLRSLESTLSTIKAVLLDAEEQQAKNRELREWLGKLKGVFHDADDLLDEFQIEALQQQRVNQGITRKVRKFLRSPYALVFHFSMSSKLKEMRERLEQIASDRANFHLTERVLDRRAVHIEREMTHSFVRSIDVIGRDSDKKNIVKMLMSSSSHNEHVSVIPIVGIGGLGKTTLAKLVYNDEEVVDHFEMRMWVCVSDDFDIKILMRKIISSATNTSCADLDIDQLQHLLQRNLVARKFLLILDDVWNSDRGKWYDLKSLLMGGAGGSKIITTTRSKSVASVMGTAHSYNLDGLSFNDCLSVFLKWAFPTGEEGKHPNLLKIRKDIVKKCKGVPLAARTLGSLLFKKTDESNWLRVRNSEIWKLKNQTQHDILPALRLSYDQLPSYLKQWFAYCSIFQKGQHLLKDELIQLWIAQGLIQSSDDQNEDLEDVGRQYFDELCSMSFFQEVEENGPLHVTCTMHDLVHDLAQYIAQTDCILKRFHKGDISRMVRHVSFLGCENLSVQEIPSVLKLEKLRTIFFPRDGVESGRDNFVDVCIRSFLYLRVVDLADSCFEVLPDSIGNLKHLRYLNLNRNYFIKKLPNSICKLLNLQTLWISDCKELRKLPRNIGNLVSLRHFYITTKQKFFSKNGIGCLTSLRSLWITGCVNLVSLPEEIGHLTALQTLAINRCPRLASLPNCIANLTTLQNLMINDCEELNLEEVEGTQGLSIRTMVIGELPKLVALPQWLSRTAGSLHYLRIACCPNLVNLPEWLRHCTSLQKLEILECPKLSMLPEGFQHLNALKVLRITECNMLIRRCQPRTGEDWRMTAHIPEIYLNKTKISSTRS